jgi:hypothetical protein
LKPVKVIKKKVIAKGPKPGDLNYRAIAKVSVLAIWLVVPALVGQPLFPLNIVDQYIEDVSGFMQNNTTWWELPRSGRVFYVYFPVPWIVGLAAWYELIFRQRRKRLFVNGQMEGITMLMVGPGAPREGHLYDIACILYNGFRHINWFEFPHPLTGSERPPNIIIYYRDWIFTHPLRWHKISTTRNHVILGYGSMWVEGKFAYRVRHPSRPVLDYEVLTDDKEYTVQDLNFSAFQRTHRDYQEQILKDNYRMTQGEPGVAKILVRSSLMTISEDTRMDYFDQMTEAEQAAYMARAKEGEIRAGSTAGGTTSE